MGGRSTDITEHKREMDIKDEFIGLVSHEMRTPLTVIVGALSTARDERVSEEERGELLEMASSGASSMATILENMLELTRHRAGHLKLEKRPCRIADIADKAKHKVINKYDSRDIILEIPQEASEVSCDATRIEQVIYNLLENAAKYSPEGSEVKVFSRREKDGLLIGVSDHGIGITPENQKKLFEPFTRLKGSGNSGIGLGLVVCKHLVEAHGGHIWVESKPGEGSTFFFSIPRGK